MFGAAFGAVASFVKGAIGGVTNTVFKFWGVIMTWRASMWKGRAKDAERTARIKDKQLEIAASDRSDRSDIVDDLRSGDL
jgi:hypothetical protein